MRLHGHHEQVPQRAGGGLARNGLPCRDRDRQRQEQRQRDDQSCEGHEEPVAGDLADERRPVAVAPRRRPLPSLRRIATAIRTGTQASAASRAWLRRRPKTSRSSERSSRVDTARRARTAGAGVRSRTGAARQTCEASLVDIEALPRQRDEHVLEVRPLDGQLPAHRRRRAPTRRAPVSGGVSPIVGREPSGLDLGRGQARAARGPGRTGVAGPATSTRSRGRPRPAARRACPGRPGGRGS